MVIYLWMSNRGDDKHPRNESKEDDCGRTIARFYRFFDQENQGHYHNEGVDNREDGR